MSGRLGNGILDGLGHVAGVLSAAGIPTMPFDGGEVYVAYTAGVPTVGDQVPYVTLRLSGDWDDLGGNSDDLAEVYDAILAALDTTGTPYVPYWGPGAGDTDRNVLIGQGSAVALSLGWPNSDTHG